MEERKSKLFLTDKIVARIFGMDDNPLSKIPGFLVYFLLCVLLLLMGFGRSCERSGIAGGV